MPGETSVSYASAVFDFQRARRRADVEEMMARLTGRSTSLLSYDEVRSKLSAVEGSTQRLQDVPLDAIVGSVDRYSDFTRTFLPRVDRDSERWARVKRAVTSMAGLPPIELYQLGEAYFVRDGHHRVSVARDLGATHIQAYVTPVHSRVALTADADVEQIVLKAEYAAFLEQTSLDRLRPGSDVSLSVPGKYTILKEHIAVHRYFMGLEQQREIPYEEAVAHWHNTVYLPVVEVIRDRGVLREFPGRTEADLYLWLSEHRSELEEHLGWRVSPEAAATSLSSRFSRRPGQVIARLRHRVADLLTPDSLEGGEEAGAWRRERQTEDDTHPLFSDILVAMSEARASWECLDKALLVAQREHAVVHGLHVVPGEDLRSASATLALKDEFERRCQTARVSGSLVIQVGGVPRTVCDRATWTDLVVLGLTYPPPPQPLARLSSGLSTLMRRCSRPVLLVPISSSALGRALLAYDGSPKAKEALYVATYMAGAWRIGLTVVSVSHGDCDCSKVLPQAREYLESRGVQAQYVEQRGAVAERIVRTADEDGSDVIVMGGYGVGPVLGIALGSTVDEVLRTAQRPVLICR
jgi:nucleotide-binding universal stress UspA family protein